MLHIFSCLMESMMNQCIGIKTIEVITNYLLSIYTIRILPVTCVSFVYICNSYTMGCPPVRGDNPRALGSGLSYVQMDKHRITILHDIHQCRPCTSSDISCLSW